MNDYYIIPSALIISLIIAGLVSIIFKRRFAELWMFIIITFLATWAGQLWIPRFGPVSWGVSWVSLICMPIFFWVFILALTTPSPSSDADKREISGAIKIFFWILLFALILSLSVSYYRINQNKTNTDNFAK